MLLITEYVNETKTIIEEGANGKKDLFIEGVFMQAEQQNRNGRIYPQAILESQVNRYVEEYVKTNRAIGELNHPQSPQVNPERASHLITDLRTEGHNFIGRAKILDTPMGRTVRGLVEGGVQMGVSSRGLGSVKTNRQGVNEIQEDFKLICVDVVADPSAPDAFVNGIMEGVSWVWEGDILKEQSIEVIKKQIMRTPKARIAEAQLKAFESIFAQNEGNFGSPELSDKEVYAWIARQGGLNKKYLEEVFKKEGINPHNVVDAYQKNQAAPKKMRKVVMTALVGNDGARDKAIKELKAL